MASYDVILIHFFSVKNCIFAMLNDANLTSNKNLFLIIYSEHLYNLLFFLIKKESVWIK